MSQYDLFKLYKLQRRPTSGGTWEDVVPTAYSYDGDGTMTPVLVEENSTQCGYVPPINPEYRWVNMDSATQYYCSGTTKYYKQKKQISVDSGVTWNDMSPMEYRMGSSAETNSVDCGGGFEPQYKWVNITPVSGDASTYWCDDCPTPPSPTPSYSGQYLTFVATEGGKFKFSGNSIDYSLDSGITWTSLASNTYTPTVSAGNKIMWKGELTPKTDFGIGVFYATKKYVVEGNVMSLLFGDNFANQTSLSGKDYAFCRLFDPFMFYDNTNLTFDNLFNLTSAENLILPATTLSSHCYLQMFAGCQGLTTPPQLPATTLADGCYSTMFNACSGLTTAPELPATTLAQRCYYNMFENCKSLTTAPSVLPATTLADSCYAFMFQGCTNLTTAPEISATTLAYNCCEFMFLRCASLTTAPSVLPATTLAPGCYIWMFQDCTSLTTAPVLPATTSVYYCYKGMFWGCSSLNSITCLATSIINDYAPDGSYGYYVATSSWVNGVSPTGTFTKAANMNDWPSDSDGIPNGWTVVNYSS